MDFPSITPSPFGEAKQLRLQSKRNQRAELPICVDRNPGSMVIGKIDDRMPSRKRGSCNNDDDDDSAKPTDIPDANIDRKRKVAWLHRKLEVATAPKKEKAVAKAADNDSGSDESDNEEPQTRKMKAQPALTTNAVKQNNKATRKESSSDGGSSEESSDDEATKTHMAKQAPGPSKCPPSAAETKGPDNRFHVCKKKMESNPSTLCLFCPPQFRLFVEHVLNLKFDEKPNYAEYISLFEVVDNQNPYLWPIDTEGPQKLVHQVGHKRGLLTSEEQFKKKVRLRKPMERWICVFNPRQAMHQIQRVVNNVHDAFLASHIERGWKDGFMISSIASCKNLWVLIMDTCTGLTKQVYKLSPCFPDKEWIEKQWEKNYCITAVAGANNGSSLVVMSKGTEYGQQCYVCEASFPFSWIKDKWSERFYVTSMATSGGEWRVVMSKAAGFNQVVELDFLYPTEGIHCRWNSGFSITAIGATSEQAAFVLSKPKGKLAVFNVEEETLRFPSFPSTPIKERWSKKFYVTSICYGAS